jgi:hypothetical protein
MIVATGWVPVSAAPGSPRIKVLLADDQVRVLILTTYDTDACVFEALQAGISGACGGGGGLTGGAHGWLSSHRRSRRR